MPDTSMQWFWFVFYTGGSLLAWLWFGIAIIELATLAILRVVQAPKIAEQARDRRGPLGLD
jgi:hypothetical protein